MAPIFDHLASDKNLDLLGMSTGLNAYIKGKVS